MINRLHRVDIAYDIPVLTYNYSDENTKPCAVIMPLLQVTQVALMVIYLDLFALCAGQQTRKTLHVHCHRNTSIRVTDMKASLPVIDIFLLLS